MILITSMVKPKLILSKFNHKKRKKYNNNYKYKKNHTTQPIKE